MCLTHELVPGNNEPSALTCCLQASPDLITQPFPAIPFPDPKALLYPAGDRSSGPWVPPLEGVTRWHSGHWHTRWLTSLGHLVPSHTWYQPASTGTNRLQLVPIRTNPPQPPGCWGESRGATRCPPCSTTLSGRSRSRCVCEVLLRAEGNVAGYRACVKKSFWISHLHDISFTHDTSFSNDP